jgi:hypothetical protein
MRAIFLGLISASVLLTSSRPSEVLHATPLVNGMWGCKGFAVIPRDRVFRRFHPLLRVRGGWDAPTDIVGDPSFESSADEELHTLMLQRYSPDTKGPSAPDPVSTLPWGTSAPSSCGHVQTERATSTIYYGTVGREALLQDDCGSELSAVCFSWSSQQQEVPGASRPRFPQAIRGMANSSWGLHEDWLQERGGLAFDGPKLSHEEDSLSLSLQSEVDMDR